MNLFAVRLDDYGHGDFTPALVAANNKDQVFNLLVESKHRFEPDAMHKIHGSKIEEDEPRIVYRY